MISDVTSLINLSREFAEDDNRYSSAHSTCTNLPGEKAGSTISHAVLSEGNAADMILQPWSKLLGH